MPNYSERKTAFDKAINSINNKAGYQVIRNHKTSILAEMSKEFNYADVFQSMEKQ